MNYSQNAVVLENQPAGTFVLRVHAHDADMGVNGEVKYGIMHRDGVSSGFDIDPDTGEFPCRRGEQAPVGSPLPPPSIQTSSRQV